MPELATKADVLAIKTDLRATEQQLQTELRASFSALEAELRGRFEIQTLQLTLRFGVMWAAAIWFLLIIVKLQ